MFFSRLLGFNDILLVSITPLSYYISIVFSIFHDLMYWKDVLFCLLLAGTNNHVTQTHSMACFTFVHRLLLYCYNYKQPECWVFIFSPLWTCWMLFFSFPEHCRIPQYRACSLWPSQWLLLPSRQVTFAFNHSRSKQSTAAPKERPNPRPFPCIHRRRTVFSFAFRCTPRSVFFSPACEKNGFTLHWGDKPPIWGSFPADLCVSQLGCICAICGSKQDILYWMALGLGMPDVGHYNNLFS